MACGDLIEDVAAGATRWKVILPEWAIGNERDAIFTAPRNNTMLRVTFAKMIERLIAGNLFRSTQQAGRFLKVVGVEIADAVREYFPAFDEFVHGPERLFERIRAAPMQKIAVEPIGAEPLERVFASLDRAIVRGVRGQHLGYEEGFITPARDSFTHDVLGGTAGIHFRCIDVREPDVEAVSQRADGFVARALLDVPGALADNRHLPVLGAERDCAHS